MTLVASLVAFLSAILTLIAWAIDIALYAHVKAQANKLSLADPNTFTGPGMYLISLTILTSMSERYVAFWMTFAAFLLLIIGGLTVCCGRRRDRMSGASNTYPLTTGTPTRRPGFLGRFRKN